MYFYPAPEEQVRIPVLGDDIYILIRYEAAVTIEKVYKMENASSWRLPFDNNVSAEMYTGRTELVGDLYVKDSENSWHRAASDTLIASLDQDNRFQKLTNMGTMIIEMGEYDSLAKFSEETRVIELEKILVDMLFHKYHSEYETYVKTFFNYLADIKNHTQIDWK